MLNTKQACAYLKIKRYLFDAAVATGQIPFKTPSKRKMFNTEDLDRWLKNTRIHIDCIKTEGFGMPISISRGKTGDPSTIEELLAQEKDRLQNVGPLKKSTKHIKKTRQPAQA